MITHPDCNFDSIKYGFFGRKGGVSSDIYKSLNCGFGSSDSPDNVSKNRQIVAEKFGLNSQDIHTLYQIHSNKVITADENFNPKTEADALVTNKPGKILGILTADCCPVLFIDDNAQVIGAAHAGWRGAISDILSNTINAMERLGANKENITTIIGPTIAQASYEVGAEFRDNFLKQSEDNEQFFIDSIKNNHYMFDLPAYVRNHINKIGIKGIYDVKRDTCKEEENFFSYRRTCLQGGSDYGRNLSVICLQD